MTLKLFAVDSTTGDATEPHHSGTTMMVGGLPVGDTLYRHAFDMRGVEHHLSTVTDFDINALLNIPYLWSAFSNVLPTDMVYTLGDTSITVPIVTTSNNDGDRPSFSVAPSSTFDIASFVYFLNTSSASDITLSLYFVNMESGVISSTLSKTIVRPATLVNINVTNGMSIRLHPTKADLFKLITSDSTITDIELVSGPTGLEETTITVIVTTSRLVSGYTILHTQTITSDVFTPGTIVPDISIPVVSDVSVVDDTLSVTVMNGLLESDVSSIADTVYLGLSFGTDIVDISTDATVSLNTTDGNTYITAQFPFSDLDVFVNNAYIMPSKVSVIQRSDILGSSSLASRPYVGPSTIRVMSGIIPTCCDLDSTYPMVYGTMITDTSGTNRFLKTERPNAGSGYVASSITDMATGYPVAVTTSKHALTSMAMIMYNHPSFGYTRLIRLDTSIPGTDAIAYTATEVNGNVHSLVSTDGDIYVVSTDVNPQNEVTYSKIDTDGTLTNIGGSTTGTNLHAFATATMGTSLPTMWSYDVSSGAPTLEYSTSISSVYRLVILDVYKHDSEKYWVLGYVQSPNGYLEVHVLQIWYTTKWNITQLFAKQVSTDNTLIIDYGKMLMSDDPTVCIVLEDTTYLWSVNADAVKKTSFVTRYAAYQNGQILLMGSKDGFGCIKSNLDTSLVDTTLQDAATMQYYLTEAI